MSDLTALAWEWNARRQAINPNKTDDSAIEYLAHKGERKALAYGDLVDAVYRAPMRPRARVKRERHLTAKAVLTTSAAGVQTLRHLSVSASLSILKTSIVTSQKM